MEIYMKNERISELRDNCEIYYPTSGYVLDVTECLNEIENLQKELKTLIKCPHCSKDLNEPLNRQLLTLVEKAIPINTKKLKRAKGLVSKD